MLGSYFNNNRTINKIDKEGEHAMMKSDKSIS